jgi:hypothetical protein
MWEKLVSWFRWIWDFGNEVRVQGEAIKKLKQDQHEFLEFMRAISNDQDSLRKDNEMLRQQLLHERELRERDIRELKTELRLQISEELRRLDKSAPNA